MDVQRDRLDRLIPQSTDGSRLRPDRVADQIRSELALLLAREVHDPGIGFVTLTRVQVTPDLQQRARLLHGARRREGAAGDRRARSSAPTPFLRRQIGSRLRLRRVPELEFLFDESIARPGPHRADPATSIHAERAAAPADDPADDPRRRPMTTTPTIRRRSSTRSARGSASCCRRTRGPTATRSDRSWRWPTRCAALGKEVARRQRRPGAAAAAWRFPASPTSRSRRARRRRRSTPRSSWSAATSRAPASPASTASSSSTSITIRATRMYGAINWFDAARRRLRRDGVRPRSRALGVPLTPRDRDAHLPRDPHRHRVVPLLEHLAADVRHLPRSARGGRRSGRGRAQRLRQQQHGPAEAVRRAC